jgi:hypothetical protein
MQMVLSETAENRTGEDFVHLGALKMLLASQIKVHAFARMTIPTNFFALRFGCMQNHVFEHESQPK